MIGLDDYLLYWLHSYLTNRKQTVVAEGESSDELSDCAVWCASGVNS